jgi:putative transposase
MQGLGVRVAKAMNRLMGTRGPVLGDHYHARTLETPTELVDAIAYVLGNAEHHYGAQKGADPFSSAACDRERVLCVALSWLLLVGWRRARRKSVRLPPQLGLAG